MPLREKLPQCLLEKSQMIYTVIFTVLFAIFSLILIEPYSRNVWFEIGPHTPVGYTFGFITFAAIVIALDKMLLYRLARKVQFTNIGYILWQFAEIVFLALVYTILTLKLASAGEIKILNPSFGDVFSQALFHTLVVLGVPYLICAFYFTVQEKDNTIRLMNYGNVVTDTETTPAEQEKINLFDNEGVLKLSVSQKNILYIESDDNYIKVWYEDSHGALKQYMLRCRLKTVEESFVGSDLIRCHRKYIVNIAKVAVLSKEREGYMLDLDKDGISPIPVSRTYETGVLSKFNSR